MFNVGGGEMLAILLLALLVLGPERLPKAMGQVGKYVAQLRRMSNGFQDEIRRAMDIDDIPFRPGEQTLKGPTRAMGSGNGSVEDEVRVIGGGGDDEVRVIGGDGDAPAAIGPDDGATAPPPVPSPRAGAADGTVTPLRPRDDGDARAAG